jgi:hypothetical protein
MGSTLVYVGIILIVFIFLFAAFYYYYWAPRQSNLNTYKIQLITDETHFNEEYNETFNTSSLISRDTLYIPKLGYGISFSWEMFIPSQGGNDKWQSNFNHLKPIIKMNDSPAISYHPKKNYLSITVKYMNNPFYSQFGEVKFKDIKIQVWQKYVIVVENRNIRLYINGNLVSNKILPSIAVISSGKSDVFLGEINNNFLGKIKNLLLIPYPLSFDEIQTL